MPASLYLFPSTLGGEEIADVIPGNVIEKMYTINHFIVENERTARRFLIRCGYPHSIDDLQFFILNRHTTDEEKGSMLDACLAGKDMGLLSEAGLPGIADPGADITRLAHQKNIPVVPLSGPSSLLLALMASGMNGQNFHFHGYLPVKLPERHKKIRLLEADSKKSGASQLFIETPYRNNSMLDSLLQVCNKNTQICVACDLTMKSEYIRTLSVEEWKKNKVDLNKRPCIFIMSVS